MSVTVEQIESGRPLKTIYGKASFVAWSMYGMFALVEYEGGGSGELDISETELWPLGTELIRRGTCIKKHMIRSVL